MKTEEAIEVICAERECVSGKNCDFNCNACDLAMEEGTIISTYDMAIAALRSQQERENPKPLTLDELRQMDGEPVYDGLGYEWFILAEITDDEVIMTDGAVFDIDEDSMNTVIERFYRHKPQEESKC